MKLQLFEQKSDLLGGTGRGMGPESKGLSCAARSLTRSRGPITRAVACTRGRRKPFRPWART